MKRWKVFILFSNIHTVGQPMTSLLVLLFPFIPYLNKYYSVPTHRLCSWDAWDHSGVQYKLLLL